MDALSRVGIGLCTPRLLPPPCPRKSNKLSPSTRGGGGGSVAATCSASKWAERLISDFQFLGDSSDHHYSGSTSTATLTPTLPPRLDPPERYVSIPLDFYRVLGAETHFLGDGIRRAYEARVSKPPSYGFSHDALISRRQILQAACETLADPGSRREYNQGLVDDEEGTIVTEVPWDKVLVLVPFENYSLCYGKELDLCDVLYMPFVNWFMVVSASMELFDGKDVFLGSWSFVRVARSRRD